MNGRLKDDKGYALVMVLLVITIFMVFAMSFMGQSLNTTKQVQATESKVQAGDLAEMGTEYYKFRINDLLVKDLKKEINNKLKIDDGRSFEQKKQEAFDKVCKYNLNTILNELEDKQINSELDYGLIKNEVDCSDSKSGKIKVEYTVEGRSNGEKESIKANLLLDLDNVVKVKGNDNENNHGNEKPNNEYLPLISEPHPERACILNSSDEEKKNKKGKGHNKNNNNDIKDINLVKTECYYDGNIDISGNNSTKLTIKDSIFKVIGDFKYKNQLNENKDLEESTVYVTGDLKAQNQNGLSNANFYIGNNGTFDQLKNMNNVTIVIDGEGRFNKHIDGSNILICVNDLKKVDKKINGDVKIYAKTSSVKKDKVIVGDEAFKPGGACHGGNKDNSGDATPIWKDPRNLIIEENYYYNHSI